jgi:3-phenylpropionate/cinnamic acid dioxygenase small subunit
MSAASADDHEAIVALVGAYAERLDAGDLDGVAQLFERGTFRSGRDGAVRHGRDEVRRMYDPVLVYDDGTPRTKHVLGNIEVTVDGHAASSRCVFTVFGCAPGQSLQAVLTGRYHDRFAHAGGAWRFEERLVHPDLVGDLSRHMGARRT